MKKFHSLKSMEALLPEQLTQIADWLHSGETYQKASARIQEEFGHRVSVTSLHRFHKRLALEEAEASRPELAASALSWINFAARGEVNFSAAALEVIKQEIFALAASGTDTNRLKTLFQIVLATQAQATRERLAVVAEKRAQISADRNGLLEKSIAIRREAAQLGEFDHALSNPRALQAQIIPDAFAYLNQLAARSRQRVSERNASGEPAPENRDTVSTPAPAADQTPVAAPPVESTPATNPQMESSPGQQPASPQFFVSNGNDFPLASPAQTPLNRGFQGKVN